MKRGYIAVVGAVNIDVWGQSSAPLRAGDSNPGRVRISPGGVGRNIAHNLRLLGEEVQMLTVLGGDVWAAQIEESCAQLGIGLDRALRLPEERTSSYLCISGPDGDMALAVCDTDIAERLTPDYLARNMDLLDGAALVVFDGNLTAAAMELLTARCRAPLFADPVSAAKARKLRPFLHRIHTLKPNALEAEALTGAADPSAAAEALVRAGVRRAFVSMGAAGMAAADGEQSIRLPCFSSRLVNATGGGDAAMAALCQSLPDGCTLRETARRALAAGALAVAGEETINPALSRDALRIILSNNPELEE